MTGKIMIHSHLGQAHLQDASLFAHGMAGIGADVHDDLMDLGRVGHDIPNLRRYVLSDLYAGRQGCPEQFEGLFENRGNLSRRNRLLSLSAECKDLPHEIPCPFPSSVYLFEIRMYRALLWELIHGKLCKTDNGREDVVKVMGNAPCQGPDGLHLLGLAELGLKPLLFFFCTLSFTDVVIMFNTPPRIKARLYRLAPVLKPVFSSPLAGEHMTLKVFDIGVIGIRAQHPLGESFTVFKNSVDPLPDEQSLILSDNLVPLQAEVAFHGLVYPDDLEVGIKDKEPNTGSIQCIIDQRSVSCLAYLQILHLFFQFPDQALAVKLVRLFVCALNGFSRLNLPLGKPFNHLLDDLDEAVRFHGFADEPVHTDFIGKGLVLFIHVGGGIEDKGNPLQRFIALAVPAELKPVHDRHEDV